MAPPNPYEDVPSWWTYFLSGGYAWRWSSNPRLHYRQGLEYTAAEQPFPVVDALGRKMTYSRPFECYLEPHSGKVEPLCVQAPQFLCLLDEPNATWKRTPIRNATPAWKRIADLRYRAVPAERRHDMSKFTREDWMIVIAMWFVSVVVFLLSWTAVVFFWDDALPGKPQTKYLPLPYMGLRYSRLARNSLENRSEVTQRLHSHESWNTRAGVSQYRTFRPRFLNYLVVEVGEDGEEVVDFERRPVGQDDMTPFVVVAYCSEHYASQPDAEDERASEPEGQNNTDHEALLATAVLATTRYFRTRLPPNDSLRNHPRAFWTAENCIPPSTDVDEHGNVVDVADGPGKEALGNRDTYSISDIIRAAEHVIVVAGNMGRSWDDNALRVWGQRIWTLPEIVLSKGDSITVWHCGVRPGRALPYEVTEIPKPLFPAAAWSDALTSRQLIEHYRNLHLSRLELVKIALECLMSRGFKAQHAGDRSYVLMGLLRIRPPIDKDDSAFQAFARLSLPQDSDRLMERLICLLPKDPKESWELMTDQYKASLWDIYPDTQICGVGENDTVIVDGAKGAQIQWSKFSKVRSLQKLTVKRRLFMLILLFSPILLMVGAIMVGISNTTWPSQSNLYRYNFGSGGPSLTSNPVFNAGLVIMLLTLVLLILPAPWFLGRLFVGKMWAVEPCFFGIEGYVPIEIIEEHIFGRPGNGGRRLRWSAWGSPLSRHTEGRPQNERVVHYEQPGAVRDNNTTAALGPRAQVPVTGVTRVATYPVEPLDPTTECKNCRVKAAGTDCDDHPTVSSLQKMSRSAMGELKPFTLVDTHNMTVTLFYAARPPTALIVGGSEGGMKRAIACSLDVATGALYRETVLRIPSRSVDCMETLPRVRLGLRRDVLEGDVVEASGSVRQQQLLQYQQQRQQYLQQQYEQQHQQRHQQQYQQQHQQQHQQYQRHQMHQQYQQYH